MRIFIEVNREWFFDGGSQLFLQGIYKIRYPAAPVIVVAVTDEDVVFEGGDEGGHWVKVDILNVPNLHLMWSFFFKARLSKEISERLHEEVFVTRMEVAIG